MGLRINKAVGWGTDALDLKDPEEFDERREALFDLSVEEWVMWISTHETEILSHAKKHGNIIRSFTITYLRGLLKESKDFPNDFQFVRPGWCFEFDEEFGQRNTILFWPFHMAHKCHRRDDLIDWFEEGMRISTDSSEVVRFVPRKCGIWPFEKGDIPYSVIATCIFLGIEDVIPKLKEALYVYWG